MTTSVEQGSAVQKNQFGTFAGVFTPSVLTILGVIMFLRAGYIVGEAGIRGALTILLVSEVIVFLTAISMSAIATNTQVKGGGAYFLISRVLGPQFGGSIGLALYLAQALSVPFYIIGFTQAVVVSFPILKPWFLVIGMSTASVLFAINYVGAKWAIKTQYLVMALLALSIVSFLGGAIVAFDPATFAANMKPGFTSPDFTFWTMFAIYFPAVTGILAGINMSGDLKNPARSLVRGTFAAITAGFIVYLLQMVLCGGSQARADLVGRPYEMLLQNALFGTAFLVIGGVFAATLSSAVGSLLGAPRVLQALARDRIVPGTGLFARGTEKGDEPREAMWMTLAITLGVIFLASGADALKSFDVVATVVTMFFLCTYGMINLAAFVESFGGNPSFRPRFRLFHWSASLLGAAACVGVMLLIDYLAASVALAVLGALHLLISRRVYQSAFGDARRGFLYSVVSRALSALRDTPAHAKNWRPTFLVLSGNPQTRLNLLRFGDWMEARRGIVTAAVVMVGNFRELIDQRHTANVNIQKFIKQQGLNAYPEVVIAQDLDEGIRLLIQSHSIGPIKPNTVILGWPHEPARVVPFIHHLRDIAAFGKSIVSIMDRGVPPDVAGGRRIDIWWRGRENASLMLILAYLLKKNVEWDGAQVRILRVVEDEAGRTPSRAALQQVVDAGRIDAEVAVIVSNEPFAAVLRKYSGSASLLFLGFDIPEELEAPEFYVHFEALLKDMPTTILVRSSGEADLLA